MALRDGDKALTGDDAVFLSNLEEDPAESREPPPPQSGHGGRVVDAVAEVGGRGKEW